MQNNVPKNEKIILKIIYEQKPIEFKCELSEILENILTKFAKLKDKLFIYIFFIQRFTFASWAI